MEIKKRKNLLIIGIVTLVVVLLGSTYAFFMYSKTLKAFTLTSNSIKAEFESGTNSINIAYAYPISDAFAKQNLDKLGYLDFTVKGSVSNKQEAVTYEIYLTEDGNNTLDSSFIKVYLTNDTNKEVVTPSIYNDLPAPTLKSASDGKVILTKTETGTFESKYRIYVWIDSEYSQNEVNQTFSFKVNLYAYNDVPTIPKATDVVKATIGKSNGIIGITNENKSTTDKNSDIREYRYSGEAVDNYVYYNCNDVNNQDKSSCELWRIIGVFKDENEIEHLKIVKNEILPESMFPDTYTVNDTTYNIKGETKNTVYWNKKADEQRKNDWTTAGLQYWLNSENDTEQNQGYLNYLNVNSKNMIEESKFYLGNSGMTYYFTGFAQPNFYYYDTTIESYIHERRNDVCASYNTYESYGESNDEFGCAIWNGNQATWIGKVGLLYPSDYGFSMGESEWNTDFRYGSAYEDNVDFAAHGEIPNISTSWLQIDSNHTINEWLLSPISYALFSVAVWEYSALTGIVDDSLGVRPTLYLKNNVKITVGDGSEQQPYQLSL